MHELGMCEAVMDTVERRAAGREVQRVRLRIGVLHRVVPESLDQAFELVAAGTVADGAEVDLVTVPIHLTCQECGHEEDVNDMAAGCPACGGVRVGLDGGDELLLESLQLAAQGADENAPG